MTLGQGQTWNVVQYPLHHMTYAPAKFEAALSNGLGGNAFTSNIWFDLDPRSPEALPSTSCDLCTCKVWSCYGQWLRWSITKKIHYLTLTLRSRWSRTHKMLPMQYPRLHVTYGPAKFNVVTSHGLGEDAFMRKSCDLCTSKVWYCYIPQLRRRCIYKKIHYLTLTLVTWNVAHCPLHHVTYAPTEFEVTTSKALGGKAFTRKFNCWPWLLGSRSHKMLPCTLYIMWPIQLQSLKLLCLTV